MSKLSAEKREVFGKRLSNFRKQGKLPAVIYGPKLKESLSISIDAAAFERLWKEAGESTLLELSVGSQKARKVLIHGIHRDPVKDTPVHVDFYEVDVSKPIRVNIPIKFVGESPAEKVFGGVLLRQLHEIEIEALPDALPHEIEVDVSSIKNFEQRITLGDLKFGEGAKATHDASVIVALVEPPKTAEEIAAEEGPAEIDFESIGDAGKKPKAEEEEETTEEPGEKNQKSE